MALQMGVGGTRALAHLYILMILPFNPPVGKSCLRQKLEACGRVAPGHMVAPKCQDRVASRANHSAAAASPVRQDKNTKVLRL